jgi:hypothetical protein
MNSTIRHWAPGALVLGALALAGCDSIKDVRSDSFTELPAQNMVLGGKARNLGTRRPLILQNNGEDTCIQPADPNNPSGTQVVGECRFYGVLNEEYSTFSFGALPVGTAYDITVKKQPFAKICTVANATGTIGSGAPAPAVNCEDDPSIPRYTVTADIDPAIQHLPGLKVILTTEQKSRAVEVNGQPQVVFSYPDDDVFDNQYGIPATSPNLPIFGWRVTATVPGASELDPARNCYVTGGPVANTGGNIGDDGLATTAPTNDVAVTVNSCGFPVRVQADFFPRTTTPPAIPDGEAVSVVLREQPSGINVAAVDITSFADAYVSFMEADAQGNPTMIPYQAPSHLNAFYEVVIKGSPSGMACIPGFSLSSSSAPTGRNSYRTAGKAEDAGAVLLRRPASARVANEWVVDRVIRCRNVPAEAEQLRGVYQQSQVTETSEDGGTTVTTIRNHNYLAFFEDGTYLYGNHVSGASNNGVEQGFYQYDAGAGTILFTPFTNTNGAQGLHDMYTASSFSSAYLAPLSRTLTDVVRASDAGTDVITATFSTTSTSTVTWIMTEVGPDPLVATTNAVDGAWVTWDANWQTEDRRRVFVYQHGLYNAFHMGVNGIGNLQEACYVGDNDGLSGSWTRQGGRSGCHMRVYTLRGGETLLDLVQLYPNNCGFPSGAPVVSSCSLLPSSSSDIPNPTAELPDYPGRWPQSRNPDFTDGRPYSLVDYEVRPAGTDLADPVCPNLDKLTVWDTQNGTRKDQLDPPIPAIVLCRISTD